MSMNTRSFHILRLAAVLCTIALMAACGGEAPTAAPNGSDATDPAAPTDGGELPEDFVQIALALPDNIGHLAGYVALERGFFVEQGLDVRLQTVAGGAEAATALESGDVQFAGIAPTSIAPAIDAGIPAEVVVVEEGDATVPHYDAAISVVARLDTGIDPDNPQTLVGKRVGTNAGGGAETYGRLWLQEQGVDPEQLEFINVPVSDVDTALIQGDVDLVFGYEPFTSAIIMEMGDNAARLSQGDGFVDFGLALAGLEDYIDENPDVILRLTTAMSQGAQWGRNNLEEAAAIVTNYISGLEADVALAGAENLTFDPRVSGCTIQQYESAAELLAEVGNISEPYPGTEAVDPSFSLQVQEERPELFEDLPPIPPDCEAESQG